jgi:hypothetical protein
VTIPEFCSLPAFVLVLPRAVVILLLVVLGSSLGSSLSVQPLFPGDKKPEKPYALIYGTVFDSVGRTVYGVRVKIRRSTEKKPRWELYSDHSGEFAQRVPAGQADYVIWADLKGYKSMEGKKLEAGPEVTLHIENDERANVSLHLK